MVTLVRHDLTDRLDEGKNVVERSDMEFHPAMNMPDILQLVGTVLDGDPPDDAVDLVPLGKEQIGQIGTVLAGNTGNKSSFNGHILRSS